MASHESYYNNATPNSSTPPPPPRPQSQSFYASPDSGSNPPPPPPKPYLPINSTEPSRTGTPQTPTYTPGPPLQTIPQQTGSPRPQPPIPHASPTTHSQPLPQPPPPPNHEPPPPIEAHWLPPSLPSKPTTELSALLSNPSLLTSLAHTHPSYPVSTAHLTATIQANLDLAALLSALESQVQQSRSQAAQLLLQHTTLSTQWRRKQSEMDDALSPWGPRAMYQRLVSSINEQEAVLRAVQESFLEGGEDAGGKASEREVGEWVRRIREGTTTLEKRREMRARWDEGRVGGWR